MVTEPWHPEAFITTVISEVNAGNIPMARIDDAVTRILTKKFELGLFERPYANRTNLGLIGSPAHRDVARQAVRESLVLLKNEGDLLPLDKSVGTIYVSGSNAHNIGHQCGGWTTSWLGGSGDISAMLDHIGYAVKKVGVDHVTIGMDSAYVGSGTAEEQAKVPSQRRSRPRWEGLWLENDAVFAPEWHQERQLRSLAWTNWPMITVGLVERGYTDEDIQKIIGGNILRVARQALA